MFYDIYKSSSFMKMIFFLMNAQETLGGRAAATKIPFTRGGGGISELAMEGRRCRN